MDENKDIKTVKMKEKVTENALKIKPCENQDTEKSEKDRKWRKK